MNFILNLIKSIFGKIDTQYGLLLDAPEKLEQLPHHELFAGGQAVQPDWKSFCPPFRYQGSSMWCTAFAGSSLGYIFEKKENQQSPLFSPLELFYRSGGQLYGNYLINTAQAIEKSIVQESDVPTPTPNAWSLDIYNLYKNQANASPDALDRGTKYKLKSCANVSTNRDSLRQALNVSPLMIAIGIGKGYWSDPAPSQKAYNAYHCVLLVDIDINGCYVIFDSLEPYTGFSGFHRLSPDYEILTALSFIDLPDDWQEKQSNSIQTAFVGALGHYGLDRNIVAEQQSANHFSQTLKANPTLLGLAGKQWTIIVNALAYGGYSEQDILNHLTNLRRTGKPIFDLNKPRNKQV